MRDFFDYKSRNCGREGEAGKLGMAEVRQERLSEIRRVGGKE
jgi:hypothetical protein